MTDNTQIEKALRMVETAEANLKGAKQILEKLVPHRTTTASVELDAHEEGDIQIVEGIFDGQCMYGPNGKMYPVPANYASKSKLLEGDKLKLTVMPNGTFLYKQIEPAKRKNVKGTLIKEDGQFKVLTRKNLQSTTCLRHLFQRWRWRRSFNYRVGRSKFNLGDNRSTDSTHGRSQLQ